ncbi:unnamed protein product [Sphagnum troendelagicum]
MAMAMMRRRAVGALATGVRSCMQQRQVLVSTYFTGGAFVVPQQQQQQQQENQNQKRFAVKSAEFASLLGCGQQQQLRFLASTEIASNASGKDRGFLRVLKAEIEHEDDAYDPPRALARGPPRPFTLTDTPGKPEVILRRSYGEEDIALKCVSQSSDFGDSYNHEYEDQDEEQEQKVVNLKVSVTKGADQPALVFSCFCQPDSIDIDRVYYVESPDLKETFYDGPEFSSLDETLQKQFEKYLDARGINGELSNYLLDLLEDKEQREYIRWLKNIESFIKK